MSNGTFLCDTYGSYTDRLSLCKFDFGPATSQKFGIEIYIAIQQKLIW